VNVISHAFAGAPEASAEVQLELDDAFVRLRFSDAGPPFDPLQEAPLPDLELPTEERPIGGLGVLLCRRLADRIEYRREAGHNVLLFEKRRASGA
ncbi:MAG TPA: ATP-binding protein, partial [Gammaproteobacteria bacterium]